MKGYLFDVRNVTVLSYCRSEDLCGGAAADGSNGNEFQARRPDV